jgi:hypothetical protein
MTKAPSETYKKESPLCVLTESFGGIILSYSIVDVLIKADLISSKGTHGLKIQTDTIARRCRLRYASTV